MRREDDPIVMIGYRLFMQHVVWTHSWELQSERETDKAKDFIKNKWKYSELKPKTTLMECNNIYRKTLDTQRVVFLVWVSLSHHLPLLWPNENGNIENSFGNGNGTGSAAVTAAAAYDTCGYKDLSFCVIRWCWLGYWTRGCWWTTEQGRPEEDLWSQTRRNRRRRRTEGRWCSPQ